MSKESPYDLNSKNKKPLVNLMAQYFAEQIQKLAWVEFATRPYSNNKIEVKTQTGYRYILTVEELII